LKPAKLLLRRGDWEKMRRHVRRCSPLEACGLLAGTGAQVELVIGVPNADRSPVRFRMDPRAQWRAFQRFERQGLELLAIYHSHPRGPADPSPTDHAEAAYPVVQVIWAPLEGKWQGRGFLIAGGTVQEVALEIQKSE